MNDLFITYVGYAASGVVLISFLMKSIRLLRMVNILGCSLFVTYGFLIDSYPVILTNTAIAIINGYYLVKQAKKHEEVTLD